MPQHRDRNREEWLAERLELLAAEKELTRQGDELARRRRELPWVPSRRTTASRPTRAAPRWPISSGGARSCSSTTSCSGPTTRAGCPACSAIADGFNGSPSTSKPRRDDVGGVARADRATAGVQAADGMDVPLGVLVRERLQHDFNVSVTEEQQRGGRSSTTSAAGPAAAAGRDRGRRSPSGPRDGTDWATYPREAPGVSAFALEDGVVYHTYSAYARGLDGLWGMYQWLDRAPKGRNEDGLWFRRRDEY